MIISQTQARLAAEYLREHPGVSSARSTAVPPELIAAARAAAASAPDPRPERMRQAADYLDAGLVDAHDVAEKMIARIISDSLR
jgi:hypothetical protein